MHRGFYVTARAGDAVIWLAGPYPTVQRAWERRRHAIALFMAQAPHVPLEAFGVSNMATLDDRTPLPAGALNNEMGERYWSDEAGRLYCSHGLILYGTQCVTCEREAL